MDGWLVHMEQSGTMPILFGCSSLIVSPRTHTTYKHSHGPIWFSVDFMRCAPAIYLFSFFFLFQIYQRRVHNPIVLGIWAWWLFVYACMLLLYIKWIGRRTTFRYICLCVGIWVYASLRLWLYNVHVLHVCECAFVYIPCSVLSFTPLSLPI